MLEKMKLYFDMENLKTFEEYRFLKFRKESKKDPNEPFWNQNKKEYFGKKREEERILAAEKERLDKMRREILRKIEAERKAKKEEQERRLKREKELEQLEKAKNQAPILNKYINIIENDPDKIRKTKKENRKNNNNGNVYTYYGILFRDKTLIVVVTRGDKITDIKVNNESMSKAKEKKIRAYDVYDEEVWEEDKSPYEILGELIRDYINEGEIIFERNHIMN